ncbi:four helix bundle protein [Candidatus Gracilibacteria bacterium]|nr:four helix bundle protein [Candidatus Gracilibacteria bacterium]
MEQFHKNLDVWKVSMELVIDIYKHIQRFPKVEQYSLSDQLRRAAISIPSNIAEGSARNTFKEKIQFLYIARGSCAELDTQIHIAKNLHYISEEEYDTLNEKNIRVGQMLTRFISSLKKKNEE